MGGAGWGGGGGGGGGRPATLGPLGSPLWARRARHSGPVRPVTSGLVRPIQYKARGLVAGLKKIKFRARPVDQSTGL